MKGVITVNEIAIASVPMQPWEQPFETAEGFRLGTIFPCLRKPFYVEEQMQEPQAMPKSECEQMLQAIQQASFALIDITLYLDTHPGDQDALAYQKDARNTRKELMREFASKYYPLTLDCEGCWSDGPIPWEGGC